MASSYALESYPTLFSKYPFLQQKLDFPLPTPYQEFIFLSHYSRYISELNRRETYQEAVFRVLNFLDAQVYHQVGEISLEEMSDFYDMIISCSVFPAMRVLWAAGQALEKNPISAYNCSSLPIDCVKAFADMLYLSMSGVGVGFSVESKFISKFPEIPLLKKSSFPIIVNDSREGWADALYFLIDSYFNGLDLDWDLSQLRPAGARIKTFGGYSAGPAPLNSLFSFIRKIFRERQQKHLRSIDVYDICCKIGQIVVSGGSRRSALLSLSDLDDFSIRDAKTGNWLEENPQRALTNNSAVYDSEEIDDCLFWEEWKNLKESGFGERGIFGRRALREKIKRYAKREPDYTWLTNPCSEICIRPYGLCNLNEVVVRPNDTVDSLRRKVRIAAMMGTIQSSITDFVYVDPKWKENAEEERLLGVSFTGIMDNPLLYVISDRTKQLLNVLREEVVSTNDEWAKRLHINRSAATTCIKPSGTTSGLANTSSGIHPRYAPYYIRRIRLSENDPLAHFAINQGIPYEKDIVTPHTIVFSFYIKSPTNSLYQNDISAIEHAEICKMFSDWYTEHSVSATISVKKDEWDDLGWWVHNNLNEITGLSFLPAANDHSYSQAPFEEITEEEYHLVGELTKSVDWSKFEENEDNTSINGPLACEGSICEFKENTRT